MQNRPMGTAHPTTFPVAGDAELTSAQYVPRPPITRPPTIKASAPSPPTASVANAAHAPLAPLERSIPTICEFPTYLSVSD